MTDNRDPILAEAINWLIRMRDGDIDDWEAFTAWLEADLAHGRIYDQVALADDLLDCAVPGALRIEAANGDSPEPAIPARRWGWTAGIAAAAAVLIAVVTVPSLLPGRQLYEVATAGGEHRSIKLGDGTHIALNGASRIALDRKDPRFARLDDGEALFSVRHDAAKPFAVSVGDNRIEDVGTVFNVIRHAGTLSVEVAEGAVVFNPQRESVPLKAGQTMYDPGGDEALVVGSKEPSTIGTWREGRLIYDNVPLSSVATDLSRNLGVNVSIDPDIATRQFTGVIQVERNTHALFARLSSVLNVEVRRNAKGWNISMRGRAAN